MIMDLSYQEIYNELEQYFPAAWERIVYYAEYGEGVYQMEFFVRDATGKYTKCFDLNGVAMEDLLSSFKKIDRMIKEVRKDLDDKDKWSNLTVIIEKTGEFDAQFDYTNLLDSGYEYKEAWKKKYLI